MWRTSSSRSDLPRRVSTPGIQVTNGEPSSLMRSSGRPHSSTQSRSQVEDRCALLVRGDAQADDEANVIDQANDPGWK